MSRDWVNEAQRTLGEGEGNLTDVLPSIIAKIVRDKLWIGRKKKDGDTFHSFQEFVEYKLWWGLECPYDRLIRYCEHNEECRVLLLEQVPAAPGHGGERVAHQGDNIPLPQRGTSKSHTLRRLKRDSPALADAVIRGELTANAAAIQAGFRKPSITLNSTNPQLAAKNIREKLGGDFASQLKEAL